MCTGQKAQVQHIKIQLLFSPLFFPSCLLFFFALLLTFSLSLTAQATNGAPSLHYFPYLSRPPRHALCTASAASCVKLCAISLTFDNRCSSGNYIPPGLAVNSLLHFSLAFSLQTGAFLRPHLPAFDGPSNVIRKKLKSLHREFLHPSRQLDFFSFCVADSGRFASIYSILSWFYKNRSSKTDEPLLLNYFNSDSFSSLSYFIKKSFIKKSFLDLIYLIINAVRTLSLNRLHIMLNLKRKRD